MNRISWLTKVRELASSPYPDDDQIKVPIRFGDIRAIATALTAAVGENPILRMVDQLIRSESLLRQWEALAHSTEGQACRHMLPATAVLLAEDTREYNKEQFRKIMMLLSEDEDEQNARELYKASLDPDEFNPRVRLWDELPEAERKQWVERVRNDR